MFLIMPEKGIIKTMTASREKCETTMIDEIFKKKCSG